MALKWSKGKTVMFSIALILTTFIVMNDLVIVPIIDALYKAFPESPMGVSTIVSCTYLVVMVCSLIVPIFMNKISKRTLLIISAAVFCVFSICGGLIVNVYYVIACRVMCGICYAVASVTGIALISEVFIDEGKRTTFVGIYNGCQSLIGALMSLVSGFFASQGNWQSAFHVYWFAIPILILVIIFIPRAKDIASSDDSFAGAEQGAASASAEKAGYGSSFIFLMVIFFFFNVFYSFGSSYNSVYIAENALGDESFSGTVTFIATVASAVACCGLGIIYKKLKGYTAVLCCILNVLAYILMYMLPGKAMAIVGGILLISSYGLFMSFTYAHVPMIVPSDKIEMGIGIITSVSCAGMFVAPYLITWLMERFGGLTQTYIVCIAAGIITAVAAVAFSIKDGKKQSAIGA